MRTPDVIELKFLSLTNLNQRPHVILEIPPNVSDSTLQKYNSRLVALYSSNHSMIFGLSNGIAWTENYFESPGPSVSGPQQIDGHRWYFLVPPTTNSWKIQINYNAGVRFKNQYPVYLKRAIWVSPNLPGLAVPPTPASKP
jgi:hypothetical protein